MSTFKLVLRDRKGKMDIRLKKMLKTFSQGRRFFFDRGAVMEKFLQGK